MGLRVRHGHHLRVVAAPRWGRQQRGYAPGGPADAFSAAWCNHLLGNAPLAPILEWDLHGLELTAEQPTQLVVGGAPRSCWLDGRLVPRYQRLDLAAGSELALAPAHGGVVGYVAMNGGVAITDHNTLIAAGPPPPLAAPTRRPGSWLEVGAWAPPLGCLRCRPGPEWRDDLAPLLDGPWTVLPQRDRRGMRLAGPALPASYAVDIAPGPTIDGAVQLTRSGPIILLRDRGTIGGYARGWCVIASDVDIAAQLPSGTKLRFIMVDQDEARAIAAHKRDCGDCAG